VHEVGHFLRKALDHVRHAPLSFAQFLGEDFVLPTQQNQLQLELRLIEMLRDVQHCPAAVASEKYQACRDIRPQSQALPLGRAIGRLRIIKPRVQNHSRGLKNLLGGITQLGSLLGSLLRAANDVLRLALEPEMRRIICNVRQDGEKWPVRTHATKAFKQHTIEVRHHGNEHVGLRFLPVRFQNPHNRPAISTNDHLQRAHQLGAAERPPRAQHGIVKILNTNSGVLLENIGGVEKLL